MHGEDQKDLVYDWNIEDSAEKPKRKISLHDETLREGIQSVAMQKDPSVDQKLASIRLMHAVGIDSVNIGFPRASVQHFNNVVSIAQEIQREKMNLRVNCAARCLPEDISPIVEVSQKTGQRMGANAFVGSSRMRQYIEDWEMDSLLRLTNKAVSFAAEADLDVMFVTEDTTRMHPEIIRAIYTEAINSGARRVCVCDTVGHATPTGAMRLARFMRNLVDEIDSSIQIDWHGHRDRDLAVINSVAAYEGGADQVHATGLGIGERSGNTPMDLLMVNLHLLGYLGEGRDLMKIRDYVHKFAEIFDVEIDHSYPVFGSDAFATSSGVHAAAIVKANQKGETWIADNIYSGVPASDFGFKHRIEIGPMSGRYNVVGWLENRGITPNKELIERILNAAKRTQRTLNDVEITAILHSCQEETTREAASV